MNKPAFSLKVVLVSACFCLLAFLFFMSVLGENDNTKKVVDVFITHVKNKEYRRAEKSYSTEEKDKFKSLKESMEFHFLLEFSLLKYFGLTDSEDYKVEVKRNNFWLPFVSDNVLQLNFRLVSKDSKQILPNLNKKEYLKNFVTVTRENNNWKIKKFNIENTGLKDIFSQMSLDIQVDKYVQITENGFVINQAEIITDNISSLERKVIIHNLVTALETLRKSKVTDDNNITK